MMMYELEDAKRPKKWYNVELSVDRADELKQYLRSHRIYFEPSSAGNLIHFECYMNDLELSLVNDFLERRFRK